MIGKWLLIFSLFSSASWGALPGGPLKWITLDDILFGYESTFQDEEMALEPGSLTFQTPHKLEKIQQLKTRLLANLDGKISNEQEDLQVGFKPWMKFNAGSRSYKITIEPATLEVNMPGMKYGALIKAWEPVFKSAEEAGLQNSVFEGGLYGGGGHIHVGGREKSLNPFLKNPLLLRNILVYTHQHPSLLFAFSEAYDVGIGGSTATLHSSYTQKAFRDSIAEFDAWWAGAKRGRREKVALAKLLGLFQDHWPLPRVLLWHDSYINLEHAGNIVNGTDANFKATVEWRNIRPLADPGQVEAMAGLLLRLMDRMAEPDLIVPFRTISRDEFRNFLGTNLTAADWEFVKRDLGVEDERLDEMVAEYVENPFQPRRKMGDGEVKPTYSPLKKYGQYIEYTVPLEPGEMRSELEYQGRKASAVTFELGGRTFASAVFDTSPEVSKRSCEAAVAAVQ